jgi:hypothetical protein
MFGGSIWSDIFDYYGNLGEYRGFSETTKSGRFSGVFDTWFRETGDDMAPD